MAMAGSVSTGASDITGNLSGESMRIVESEDLPRVTRVRKRRRRGSGKGETNVPGDTTSQVETTKGIGASDVSDGDSGRTQIRRTHHQTAQTSQPTQPQPQTQPAQPQQPAHSKQRQKQKKGNQRQDRPSLSPSDIYAMDEAQLVELASERGIGIANLTRDQLVGALAVATAVAEGFSIAQGTLQDGEPDRMQNSYLIRTGNKGYGYGEHDAFVTKKFASQKGIRPGDMVTAIVGHKDQVRYQPSIDIVEVNGLLLCADKTARILQARPKFESLTPVYPDERFQLERSDGDLTGRILDLMCPLGKGQRAMIVAPPKAGKTTMMKSICHSIAENSPETHIMCLLIDERPEEVTDMRRSIDGEVIASTFDHTPREHTQVAEQCLERAKRLVELGRDVVIVMDSLTRLARAYNMAGTASGRILSGGMDASALYPPKKFFGAARNIENGGSLTIIATALVETDSKLDDVTFEELKGTGNSEIKLDRHLADRRMFPAIDIRESGTRNEELLIGGRELPMVWRLRNVLMEQEDNRKVPNGQHDTEGPWKVLTKSLRNTDNNAEFLVKFMVKQSQQNNG